MGSCFNLYCKRYIYHWQGPVVPQSATNFKKPGWCLDSFFYLHTCCLRKMLVRILLTYPISKQISKICADLQHCRKGSCLHGSKLWFQSLHCTCMNWILIIEDYSSFKLLKWSIKQVICWGNGGNWTHTVQIKQLDPCQLSQGGRTEYSRLIMNSVIWHFVF